MSCRLLVTSHLADRRAVRQFGVDNNEGGDTMTCLDMSHIAMRSSPPRQYMPLAFCVVSWRQEGTQEHIPNGGFAIRQITAFQIARHAHDLEGHVLTGTRDGEGKCSGIPRRRKSRHGSRLRLDSVGRNIVGRRPGPPPAPAGLPLRPRPSAQRYVPPGVQHGQPAYVQPLPPVS